ncbi:hypothetical protein M3P19_01345 [Muricauda sp. 2012CJ35-5]|uniref:DUF4382 domain-containing protein n=1 Tax=Flagellimonas spongiicola TaxID=2942208 RepID=A0ABT0PML5_9FLAO|nr:hypothetical protein [Allomuricauda spongiicola]MCL6272629.1 hypothetical protein [Allomuricauda spongiicola]
MKNLKLFIALAFVALMASCSEDDKVTVLVQDTVERGAVLRTVSFESTTFNVFDPASIFGVTIEEQDLLDGGLLSNMEIYVGFVDNTSSNGTTTAAETLVSTVAASEFTNGPNNLPRTSFSVSLGEALSALGIVNDPANVTGGDQIAIRLVVNLTDGRSFTDVDATGNVSGGSFFSSPYVYRAGINCIPTAPVTGDYELTMDDSYGDGWDGAFITVDIDGTTTDYTVSVAQATTNTETINVPDGTTTLVWTYTPGNFEGEHTYELIAPSGETAAAGGPGPTPGNIVLNICN